MTPLFLSAEPLTNSIVAVTTQGKVNLSNVQVTLNGKVRYNYLCTDAYPAYLLLFCYVDSLLALLVIPHMSLLIRQQRVSHISIWPRHSLLEASPSVPVIPPFRTLFQVRLVSGMIMSLFP